MRFLPGSTDAHDLATTPIHLGPDRADPIADWSWAPECLAAYDEATGHEGDAARLVTSFEQRDDWTSWERHPAGPEVVVCLTGRFTLRLELEDGVRSVEVGPGAAVVVPAGVWHTADVAQAGRALFVTPGRGTEHRPR